VRNKFLCSLFVLSSLICAAQVAKKDSSLSLLQDAAQAMTAGNPSRAETDLQSVLRSAPSDPRALDLLGVVRVLQHREPEAEKLFRRALQENPNFAPAHAHLGLLYVQKGRTEEALPQLREAVRIDPARLDASDALVRILQDQARSATTAKDCPKALALLADAAKYAPDNPDIPLALGTIHLQMSSWDDAVRALQRTLQLRPNDPVATYELGRAFLGEWKYEDARQQFASYVALRPDDASGHCALGMTFAALELLPDARKEFQQSIALDPAQTEAYFRLGLIDLNDKDLDEAAKNLHEVVAREPKHAGALSALGRVAFQQKHYPEAVDLLQQAIASDDSSREAHYYLGLTFARLGHNKEADDQLRIATRLEHDEAEHRRTVFPIANPTTSDPDGSHPRK
jgi:tetratricopeptide (TPR) repeat protein